MQKVYHCLLFLLLLPNWLMCQSTSVEETIDGIAKQQMEAYHLPGLAIGVIMDGNIVYAKGLGVRNMDTKAAMDEQSLFHMASVSKPFVATAIMQLVDAGQLSLDDKLITHLPYFKMADKHYQNITLRHVLTHTAGIPDVEDYEWENPQFKFEAVEQYTRSFATEELDFKPGKSFSYSNASFDIMAGVIAKVSGLTFEEYMQKYIFEPVGMENSTFYQPDVPENLANAPHIMDDQLQVAVSDVYPYNRIHAPSSTLHSNVEDMLRWAQINLSGGQIAGNAIVKEATHKQLTSPQRKIGSTSNVCLGWFSSDFEGYRLVSHTGGDLGFRTFFGFIPEINMAVVTMTNSEVYPASNTASLIFRSFLLDEDYRAWQAPIHFALKDVLMQDGIEAFKKAFWEKKNGPDAEKYDCSPSKLDELGYALIDRGQFEPAVEVFKLAIEVDPENAAWYDSVADAYRAKGDKATATAWYEKALSINPKQKFSRDKLREMKKE